MRQHIHRYSGIVDITGGKLEVNRITQTIDNRVDFGCLATSAGSDMLVNLAVYSPFLAPALCWCAFTLVESSDRLRDFIFVDESYVNIIGCANEQRLPWLQNTYEVVSGASFIAPYFTALVASIMESGIRSFPDILNKLKNRAIKTIRHTPFIPYRKLDFPIGRAVAFPFNKKMHTVARFNALLYGEIKAFYDVKYIGNLNRNLSSLLGIIEGEDMRIRDYREINWNGNFDTLILGHTSKLSDLLGIDFEEYFLSRCIQYHKNLFSFAEIKNEFYHQSFKCNGLELYYPAITNESVPKNAMGKLRRIGKPVVGIVGTGPRQGKFTLQLKLRYLLENSGYPSRDVQQRTHSGVISYITGLSHGI